MLLEEKLNLLSYLESPENIVDLTMNIYDEGDTYLTMVNGDTYYFYDEEEKIKFLRLIFSNELYLIQEFIIKNVISKDLEKYINREQYIEDKVKEYLPEFRKFQENLFMGKINGVEIGITRTNPIILNVMIFHRCNFKSLQSYEICHWKGLIKCYNRHKIKLFKHLIIETVTVLD